VFSLKLIFSLLLMYYNYRLTCNIRTALEEGQNTLTTLAASFAFTKALLTYNSIYKMLFNKGEESSIDCTNQRY
jgi:hypothetical protein